MRIILACGLLSTCFYSYGADFVVNSGETVTTTQTLTDPGDEGLIEEGGTISTAGDNAVEMLNIDQTVLNNGSILTTGADAIGINSTGDNATIVSSGLISTQGGNATGINSTGANATVINNGTILTQGAIGIRIEGANSTATNSGLIFTREEGAFGIFSNSLNGVITNTGTISTLGSESEGIQNTGNSALIFNSGTITTQGEDALGIDNLGIDTVIVNSGSIATFGVEAVGIFNEGANVHIINSGSISAAQSHALELFGLNPTLTLLRGSNLQGPVNITQLLNLNVETGLNLVLTLNPGNPGFASLNIDAPFVQVGNTVAVIDTTGIALQADVLADLSDTILGGVYRNRAAFPCCYVVCERGLWVEGLGSYRNRNRNDSHFGYNIWQGGFLVGYDYPAFCGAISLFGGASFGEAEVDQSTQQTDLSHYFGGVSFERFSCNNFLGIALVAGYSQLDNDRFVMNNLASGGVETAHACIDGFFISPEITYALQFPQWWYAPILSGTIRYAGHFFGNYTEKGSAANLSVKDRDIQLVTVRGELGLPFSKSSCLGCRRVEPYLGVAGRFQVSGNQVDAELLGQDLSFDAGNAQNLALFLVGFRGTRSFGRANFFLNLEANFDNHNSSRIFGEAGIGLSF